MVDNDSDDEYQLNDPDALTLESDNSFDVKPDDSTHKTGHETLDIKRIIRHGLIVIGVIFLLLFLYKIVGTFLSNKQEKNSQIDITPIPTLMVPEKNVQTKSLPIIQQPKITNSDDKQFSSLERQQQTMGIQVTEMNTQLGSLSSTMSEMTAKIAALNQMIVALNEKIDTQSAELISMQKKKIEPVRSRDFKQHVKVPSIPVVRYYLQAVIPGRAWLVAENGTTLTVREGSSLAGYGFIRSIDPKQGHVLTSSGKVIKFSQADS